MKHEFELLSNRVLTYCITTLFEEYLLKGQCWNKNGEGGSKIEK